MHPVLHNLISPFISKLTNPPRPLFDDTRKIALCIPIVGHVYSIWVSSELWAQCMNRPADEPLTNHMESLNDYRTLGVIRNLLTAGLVMTITTVALGALHALSIFCTFLFLALAGKHCLDIRTVEHWMQSQAADTPFDGETYGPLPLTVEF